MLSWALVISSLFLRIFLFLKKETETKNIIIIEVTVRIIVGSINLPIIKWSVDWWNTLHQPASVTRLDTPAIHYEMLIPLLVMSLSFMLYYITIVIIRMHNEILVRKINSLRIS